MPCMICSAPGFSTGDGHLCVEHGGQPPAAPPRPRPGVAWQVLTWLFVIVTVVYAGLLVGDIGALAAADAIVADPASISTAASRTVFDLAELLNSTTLLWIWVYVAGYIAWSVSSRRSAQRLGHDRNEVLRHWTYTVWRLSLVLVIVLSVVISNRALPSPDDVAAFRDAFIGRSHAVMAYSVVRIGMLALLSTYVIIVWRRLTRSA